MKIKQVAFTEKVEIDVKEWNEQTRAFLKPFTAYETLAFNDLALIYYDRENSVEERFNAAFDAVQLALVDVDGNALLSDNDREAVRGASFEPIIRTFTAIFKRNENKEFETIKKN